jgi:hypothetical protein
MAILIGNELREATIDKLGTETKVENNIGTLDVSVERRSSRVVAVQVVESSRYLSCTHTIEDDYCHIKSIFFPIQMKSHNLNLYSG